jgi:hypothetical protein
MKRIFCQIVFIFLTTFSYAQDWSMMISPTNKDLKDIVTIGDTIIVASDNGIFLSFDLGGKWDKITPASWGEEPYVKAIAEKNKRIFAYYRMGYVYSDDFGKNWLEGSYLWAPCHLYPTENDLIVVAETKVYLGQVNKLKKIGKKIGIVLFAAGTKDKVCTLTEDNKASLLVQNNGKWIVTEINDGLPKIDEKNKYLRPLDIIMTESGDFLALFHFDKLYRLNEKINKWESIDNNITGLNGASITNIGKQGKSIWVVTSHGAMFRTDDNGVSFSPKLNSSYAHNLTKKIAIGRNYIFVVSDNFIVRGKKKE